MPCRDATSLTAFLVGGHQVGIPTARPVVIPLFNGFLGRRFNIAFKAITSLTKRIYTKLVLLSKDYGPNWLERNKRPQNNAEPRERCYPLFFCPVLGQLCR
jgi:hypothetical protein